MLQILTPQPYQTSGISPWTELTLQKGQIRWGHFFRADEISALVSVKGKDRFDEFFEETRPEYVSYFFLKNGKWVFRQFLGNARGIEIHYRKDRPSVFLQGWFKTGRYEGEHVSWYFDKKAGRLEPTGFEDTGPFYLKGDYLVCQTGFQRLAHDWTNTIYEYRDGKKGRLLVDYAGSDSGAFRFSYRDKQSGKWVQWNFFEDQVGGELTKVRYVEYPEKKDGSGPDYSSEEKSCEGVIMESISEESVFDYLTGLDHSLLEEGWVETLPQRVGFEWIPVRTEGDEVIVKTFQGGKDFGKRMN